MSGRRPDFRQYAEVGVLSFLEVDMVTAEKIDLLTITQAARIIGTTRGAVHHHRLTGKLPTIRVGGVYLIPRESVEQLRRDRAARLGQSETASR
jgi:excisionase family DNA binding protein